MVTAIIAPQAVLKVNWEDELSSKIIAVSLSLGLAEFFISQLLVSSFFPDKSAIAYLGGLCKDSVRACIGSSEPCCLSWHLGGRLCAVGLITEGEAEAGWPAHCFLLAHAGGRCPPPSLCKRQWTPLCDLSPNIFTTSVPWETLACCLRAILEFSPSLRLCREGYGRWSRCWKLARGPHRPNKEFFKRVDLVIGRGEFRG